MSAYIRSKVSNSSITDVSIEAENSSAKLRQDGSFKLPYASDLGDTSPLGSIRYNDVNNRLEFKNPEGWKQVDQFAPEEIVTDAELQAAIDNLAVSARTGQYSDLLNIPQDIATEGYVDQKIADLINSAPEHLDTLNELAEAIKNNSDFSSTIFGLLDTKLNLTGGELTGPLYLYGAPTAPQEAATKSYVDSVASGIEVLNSDDVPEGIVNLYYTPGRATVDARLAIVAGTGIVYDAETGLIAVGQEVFTTSDVTFKTVSADQFISTSSSTPTINSATTIVLNAAEGIIANGPLTLKSMAPSDINGLFVDRGTIVFDTVVNNIKLYDGAAWQELATKQYIDSVVSNIVNNAPGILDTLNELANAIGNDPNFINTITAGINLKLNSADFNPRFDERLATKTTSQLAEGANLYYTDARVKAALSAGTGLTYNNGVFRVTDTGVSAGTYGNASGIPVLTINAQGQITNATTVQVAGVETFGYNNATGDLSIGTADGNTFVATVTLDPFSTTNLAEGTNQYFTTDRARQSVSAGAGIAYDSATGTISTDSTIATKAYVDSSIANLVDNAPDLLNTLNEIAGALGDDPNFFSNIGSAVNNETIARQNADAQLQANIDAEAAIRSGAILYEGGLRGAADAELLNKINTEEDARIAGDNQLQSNLTNEVNRATAAEQSLSANLTNEANARAGADATLQANIDTEAGIRFAADTTLQNNIDAEATARSTADTTLQNNINAEAVARANADTQLGVDLATESARASLAEQVLRIDLSQETADRIAADNQINSRIDFIQANIDPAALDSLTEIVSSFQSADSIINTAIANEVANRTTAINDEATVRQNADTTLQNNINAEASGRASADAQLQTDLTNEANSRIGADAQLQSNINAEALTRTSADNLLQSNINAEALARTNADNTLQSNINAETARATGAEQQLAANLSQETADRISADNAINSRIDFIQSNMDPAALDSLVEIVGAFQSADNDINNAITSLTNTLTTRIDNEEIARASADNQLQNNIDSEALARENADNNLQNNINAETLARIGADNTLQTNLNTESAARMGADAVLQTNLDTEALTRYNADSVLQSNINAEAQTRANADTTLTNNLNAEIANRVASETIINARIDFIKANVDPAALDSLTEIVSAFQNADNNLNNTITALASTLSDRINTEIIDRAFADSQLQYNLDNEANTRHNADVLLQTNLNSEAATRANADSQLQSNINSEAYARSSADAQLQSNLNNETSARIYADNQLQNNINNEASTRAAADSALQANINSEAATRLAADNQLQANIDAEEQARILRDNELQRDLNTETAQRIAEDTALSNRILDEMAARIDADHRLNLRVTTETNARKSADYRLHLRINDEIVAREAESFRATVAEQELQTQLNTEISNRLHGDATTLWNANKFTNDTVNALTTDDIEEGTTNRYFSDELVRAGLRSEGSVFFNSTNGLITTSGSWAPGEVQIGTNSGERNQGLNAIAIGNNAGNENQGAYSIAIGAFAGTSNLPARSIVLNAQPPLGPNGEEIGWGDNEVWDSGAWDSVKGLTPTHSGFYVTPVRPDLAGDFALHYNPDNGEIFYSPVSKIADLLHGGGSVFFNPNNGLITTAGPLAPTEVKIGRNSGKINQGFNAIAIGNHAGNDNQGDYSIAIGAYAGINRLPANTIVLNAMAPVGPTGAPAGWDVTNDDWDELGWDPATGIAPTQSGFYVMPIRQDNFRGFSLHYDPSSGEVVYSATPDFITEQHVDLKIGEAVHGLASEQYVNLAVAQLVDSAPAVLDTLNELAQALGDDPNFAASVSNLIGQKLDKAGGILTGPLELAADPVYAKEAATKQYVDNAVSSIPNSTDDLVEGASNLYFTTARVRSSIGVAGSLTYDDVTGVISYTQPELFSGSYNDLTDKPELFPGDYNALINKPAIPTDISELSDNYGLLAGTGGTGGSGEPGVDLDGGSYELAEEFNNAEVIIAGEELDVIPTLPVFADAAQRDREIINPVPGMMIMCGPLVEGNYSVQIYAGTSWRTCC